MEEVEPPTPEEASVLALLVAGCTDECAAATLGVSPRTVRRRLGTAMRKLGAPSRLAAGYRLAAAGWALPDVARSGHGLAAGPPAPAANLPVRAER